MPVADIVVGVDMSDTGITGMDVLCAGIPAIVADVHATARGGTSGRRRAGQDERTAGPAPPRPGNFALARYSRNRVIYRS